MLLPGGKKNEESGSENVWRVTSVVTEEVHHSWEGQKQTKKSKDVREGGDTKIKRQGFKA